MTDFCLTSRETRLPDGQHRQRHVVGGSGSPVVLHHVVLTKFPQEVFVMSDHDELEVCVIPALVDDTERRVVSIASAA